MGPEVYDRIFYRSDRGCHCDGSFTGFITAQTAPIVFALIFLTATGVVVFCGVEKGIEKFSKVLMPILVILIIGISIYSLTIKHTGDDGTIRT